MEVYTFQLGYFKRMLGADRIVREINRDDIRFAIRVLRQLPKNASGRCKPSTYQSIIDKK